MNSEFVAIVSAQLLTNEEANVDPEWLASVVREATEKVMHPDDVDEFLAEVAVKTTEQALLILVEKLG